MATKKSARTARKASSNTRTKRAKSRTRKSNTKTATAKITKAELRQKLQNIDITDEELAKYFVLDSDAGKGFEPQVVINDSLVEDDGLEGAGFLNVANSIARWRRNRLYKRRIRNWTGIKIVAEGDSWYQYPLLLKDTIDQLNDLDQFKYAIYGLSGAGDLLGDIVKEDELTDAIEKHSPHVFLISGGGNDMVGNDRMATMVHTYKKGRSAEAYLNKQFDLFTDQIAEMYTALFARLVSRFPHLKIVCHGYDRAIPAGGNWLGKPLNSRGIKNQRLQAAIVSKMIDRFNETLGRIAAEFPGRVYYVDCRGLIGNKSNWHDELHPKNPGYFKVAQRFDETIKRALKESQNELDVDIESSLFRPAYEGSPRLKTKLSQVPEAEYQQLVGARAKACLPDKVDVPNNIQDRRGLESQLEKVNLTADFLPSSFLEIGVERAQAVCRIHIKSALGRGYGTGFLVGTRNYIMTNHHVLPDEDTARMSQAEFDYDQDSVEYYVDLKPDLFFITNPELDFTIVACDSSTLPTSIVPIEFPTDPHTVARRERVNIIQHPNGRRKEVALHDNEVTYVYQEVIRYRTDTEGGSSGSPVFNNQWVLCGLHRAGEKYNDDTALNEGIRISAILEYLHADSRQKNRSSIDHIISGEPNIMLNASSDELDPALLGAQDAGAADKAITINLNGRASITINVE